MAASANAIKAGGAFIALFVDDSMLKRGLQGAAKDLKAFGAGVQTIGTGLLAIGGTAMAPIAAGFADLMSYASELRGLSAKTGESVETLSALGFAAGRSGVELEELGKMSKHLNKHLDEAVEKGGEAEATFSRLGLSAKDLAGMNFSDKVLAIADQFAKLTNDTQKSALAQKLFGKSGDDTMRFLSKGADGIRALMQQGRDLGAVLTDTDAKALKEFGLGLKNLKDTGRFTFMALGKALIPALGDMDALNSKIIKIVKGVRLWVQDNGQLIIMIFKVSAGVVAVGTGLVILGATITQVGAVISIVVGLVSGLAGILFSPLGAILLIGAAVAYLFAQTEAGKGFGARIAGDWKASWAAILSAIQSGDLEGAFKIVLANLKVMWLDLAGTVEESWLEIFGQKGNVYMSFAGLIQGFLTGLESVWAYISALFEMLLHLATMIPAAMVGRDGLGRSLKETREGWKKELLDIQKEAKGVFAELQADEDAKKKGHLKAPAQQARDERDALVKLEKIKQMARGGMFAAIAGAHLGGRVGGGMDQVKAAIGGLPEAAAGTMSGYAIGQTLAISDKIGERIADGIDNANLKLDAIKDKLPAAPKHN